VNGVGAESARIACLGNPADDTMRQRVRVLGADGLVSCFVGVREVDRAESDSGSPGSVDLEPPRSIREPELCRVRRYGSFVCVQFWVVSVSVKVKRRRPVRTTEAPHRVPGHYGLL